MLVAKLITAVRNIQFMILRWLLKNTLSLTAHTVITNLSKGVNMTKNLNLTTDEALVLQQISESGEEDLTGLTESGKQTTHYLWPEMSLNY